MQTPELEAPDMSDPEPYVNPDAKKIMSKEALAKLAKPVDKAATRQKTSKKTKAPLFKAPPKGQFKGPIQKGPTEYIECSTCSRLFSTKEEPVRIGIRKRHAAKHLNDHKMGRIKRPAAAK